MSERIEDRDREFVRLLHKHGPASVRDLCQQLGVTATSVRHRLSRLEATAVVEHDEVSVGRGRPARRYRISSQGLRELGSNYEDLAVLLWSEVAAIDHEPTRARVFANLESRLIDRFRSADNNAALPERVAGLASRLADSGFDAGSDFSGGLPVLQGHTCPYPEIARDDRSICDLEARVFSAVLGAEVELRNRCLDGHNCCEFAVSENA